MEETNGLQWLKYSLPLFLIIFAAVSIASRKNESAGNLRRRMLLVHGVARSNGWTASGMWFRDTPEARLRIPPMRRHFGHEPGHLEAVQIRIRSLGNRLRKASRGTFWRQIDPTTREASLSTAGRSYRTAIFYHSEEQKKDRREIEGCLRARSGRLNGPIVTEILPSARFYRRRGVPSGLS